MSNWSNGFRIMSAQDIESRFAVEDGMAYLDFSLDGSVDDQTEERLDQIRGILDRIPPREADFVDLYYFRQKRQTDIATIFRVSQPTVCYRLQRAADRIKFLLKLPVLKEEEARPVLEKVLGDATDVTIMLRMYETTCQSEVAKHLGVSQGFVRHRFLRSILRLRNAGLSEMADIFDMVGANLNILREVQRPIETGVLRIIA
jgi:DNA-directed RNA polymerase specialized sigma24 family protein